MRVVTNFIKLILHKLFKKIRFAAIKNSVVHPTSKVESGSSFYGSKMERHSFCGYDCDIQNTTIGKFCSIASNVSIGGSSHPIVWVSTSPVFYANRDSIKQKYSRFERVESLTTNIGHDVWIGKGVLIKAGVEIGTGAVIGMGAVVTKDVSPYEIVAGNPARVIRRRFSESTIEALLRTEWWDWDDTQLYEMAKCIRSPKDFIDVSHKK